MSGYDHFWLECQKGIEGFDPCGDESVHRKWCHPDKANVACDQDTRPRKPDRHIRRRMGRSEDMQISFSWRNELVEPGFWHHQFKIGETTAELWHQGVVDGYGEAQSLNTTD